MKVDRSRARRSHSLQTQTKLPTARFCLHFSMFPGKSIFLQEASACRWTRHRSSSLGNWRANAVLKILCGWLRPAKSWLSHAAVDRTASILPWQAPVEVIKVSPVEASAQYLLHMRSAWDSQHHQGPPRKILDLPPIVDIGRNKSSFSTIP